MKFNIRLGIPEVLALWSSLQDKRQKGTLSKEEASLYKKWGQAMAHLSQNPQHPGLHSHEIPLRQINGKFLHLRLSRNAEDELMADAFDSEEY